MKIADEIADALCKLMAPEPTTATADPTRIPKMAIHAGSMAAVIAAKLDPVRETLAAIAGPCERLTSHRCIDEPERYTVGAYFGDDRVCDPCVADRALALFEDS